jgi:large subunit ribosomal protein L10
VTRAEKAKAVEAIASSVGKAPHVFLIDYKGINVPAVTELRRQVRASGSTYVVLKNTLTLRAVKDSPLHALSEHFSGMTAVAYSNDDIVSLAKVLHTFGKTHPHVKVKAVLVDGKAAPGTAVEALATMPSRTELVARLLGLMQSPMRRLVTVLSAPQRKLAATVAAIASQKGGES